MAGNDKDCGAIDTISRYSATLDEISDETRQLLEQYSNIAPDQVIPHCLEIRDKGWKIWPFPCIGQFRFLDLSIGLAKEYHEVLERVKSGQKLLDLGCCFGQDVRRLVADGAPSSNIYGCDLSTQFTQIGYDLFRDRDTLKTTFFEADIFDTSPDSELTKYEGAFDIIHASSFFHLFNLADSTKAAVRAVSLLKPQPGSMILGRQTGVTTPGPHLRDGKREIYRHDPSTFNAFWHDVAKQCGRHVDVNVEPDPTKSWNSAKTYEPERQPLRYCARFS